VPRGDQLSGAPAAGGWRDRVTTAAEAVGLVRHGDQVFVGTACATPRTLLAALEALSPPPPGVALVHFLADGVGVGDPKASSYRQRVCYVGRDVRALAGRTEVDYLPVSVAALPQLLRSRALPVDVALVQVAPPDEDGTCSLGVSVDVTLAAVLAADRVVAEVNPAMPRTRGRSRIPVDRIDRFVLVDTPVLEYVHEPAADVAEQIARYVARLVDDGATLQVGLGRVANAMLARLTNRRGLAVHTDVLTEPVVDLMAAGVVTGPVVASWAMGTRRLYDLLDDDERFTFLPVDEVCDPAAVARQPRMVSVTQAFSIDLTGQVCTEALDGVAYGGVSTGPDFHRGALAADGGRAVVCLASRTPAGRSAVRLDLEPGEAVTLPRSDVHWVVTEYGTAYLFGRSLTERAVALVEIAHPDERAALQAAAVERGLLRADTELRSRVAYPEAQESTVQLRDGRQVRVRPTRATDAPAMQELFHRLSERDVQTRFFHNLSSLTERAAEHLCSVDYAQEMAFAAVVGPREHERIVAASCYYTDPATAYADVAYMVDPAWQGSGLGSSLHARTAQYARAHGVVGFAADVLVRNAAMLRVFRRAGHQLEVEQDGSAYEVRMRL